MSYHPSIGEQCLYKENGGVNWFLCKVIAIYEGKIWLHNFYTGSMPVKRQVDVKFKQYGGAS